MESNHAWASQVQTQHTQIYSMKKYIIPILVLAAFVVLPWTFNHVNPYVGIIATMVLAIYLIDLIVKKFN